jgi:hypothetical protein
MGWERKRGKLDELNRYLRGDTSTSYKLEVGEPGGLEGIAVITLDSDTELPRAPRSGSPERCHPLNRPRTDEAGRVRSGYTILQPRVGL